LLVVAALRHFSDRTSELGHDRSFGDVGAMSALAPLCGLKSDMSRGPRSAKTGLLATAPRLFGLRRTAIWAIHSYSLSPFYRCC